MEFKKKGFNAEQARQIVESLGSDELYEVLADIHDKAEHGDLDLYVCRHLKTSTLEELKNRGFVVKEMHSLAIQKENLYYNISW